MKSKLKNVLLMGLSLVLVAVIAIGGTVAYLQDTDSDVNVMTLGNVSIEQIEQEWNEEQTELVAFEQNKPLLPYVGTFGWENTDEADGAYRRFTMNNVVDKYVSVKNTGKSDAFVRTFIALEMGDYSKEEFDMVGVSINKYNGDEFKFEGAWDWADGFVADIGGVNYYVMVAVHQDAVKPGETTIPSLLQVYLSKDATNETVEKLDGNGNEMYDILVFSQAVQAAGFEDAKIALNTAFGDTSKEYHPWEEGVLVVDTVDELKAALKLGNTTVILEADLTLEKGIAIADGTILNLNGHTITDASTGGRTFAAQNGSSVTVTGNGSIINGTSVSSAYAMPFYISDGTLTIENGTFNMGTPTEKDYNILAQNDSKLVINGGTFTNTANYPLILAIWSSNVEINGGFFESIGAENPDLLDIEYHYSRISTMTIKGGTFVNYDPSKDNEGDRVVVPDTHEVISETKANGDVWYTVVEKEGLVHDIQDLVDACNNGGNITLASDITVTDTLNLTEATNIDLNGHSLTVSVLEAKADTNISNGTLIHGKSTYPAISVSAGTLSLDNVDVIAPNHCNLVTNSNSGNQAAEYVGVEVWSGELIMDDCNITVTVDAVRWANSAFGIGIHGGKVTMNGGSINITNPGSTRYNYEAAIFAGSDTDKVINMNGVTVKMGDNADYLYAWGGHTILNTTDNVTDADVDTNGGKGTFTIN